MTQNTKNFCTKNYFIEILFKKLFLIGKFLIINIVLNIMFFSTYLVITQKNYNT